MQHAPPTAPQRAQRSPDGVLPQRSDAPQVLPAQQGWLTPPHATQVVPPHVAPAPQVLPAQQGWLTPPHAAHVPRLHAAPPAHASPGQHA